MLHLIDMKNIRMFFLMYLLLAVLAQKGLEIRSVEELIFEIVAVHGSWMPVTVDWTSAGLGMVTWLVQLMCSAHQLFFPNSSSNQPEQITC